MVFDARQQSAEDGCERHRDERYCDDREDDPEQEGVPFPEPELAKEIHGVFVGGVEELVRGERHRRGVEDAAGHVDERDDQDEFEWIDDVVADL